MTNPINLLFENPTRTQARAWVFARRQRRKRSWGNAYARHRTRLYREGYITRKQWEQDVHGGRTLDMEIAMMLRAER